MAVPAWSVPAALATITACVVGWNLAHGARLAALPGGRTAFRTLSGLCAFLLLPAMVIGLLSPMAPGARLLGPLAWLAPVVAVGVAVQALWVLVGRRASVVIVLPIACLDVLVAWMIATRWIEGLGAELPAWALTPGMAVSTLAAATLGGGAFLWGAAAIVPALAPGALPRTRLGRGLRALLATGCATGVAVTAVTSPAAYGAIETARTLDAAFVPARSDLAIGLRLFGVLTSAPSAGTARHDMAVADSLGVTAVHIEFSVEGATAAALDSVARSIEPRRDSMSLVVTLDLAERAQDGRMDDAAMRTRLAVIERIVRHLRPEVLVPAERVPDDADIAWWQSYYTRAAAAARRLDRNVTVALGTDASTRVDSALVHWALQGDTPVDAVALVVRAPDRQPARYLAALAAMDRWASANQGTPAVWLLGVPTAPAVAGEVAQQHLVRHAMAWAASRAWVRGIIAGDASDEMTATGLRTATGRSRRALTEVSAALRALRDLPAPTADPPTADSLRRSPDSLPPSPP